VRSSGRGAGHRRLRNAGSHARPDRPGAGVAGSGGIGDSIDGEWLERLAARRRERRGHGGEADAVVDQVFHEMASEYLGTLFGARAEVRSYDTGHVVGRRWWRIVAAGSRACDMSRRIGRESASVAIRTTGTKPSGRLHPASPSSIGPRVPTTPPRSRSHQPRRPLPLPRCSHRTRNVDVVALGRIEEVDPCGSPTSVSWHPYMHGVSTSAQVGWTPLQRMRRGS